MHVLHRIALEADNKEDAVLSVQDCLEDGTTFHWSDWAVVGGRWANQEDEGVVISYDENPEAFLEALSRAEQNRVVEVRSLLAKTDIDLVLSTLGNYNGKDLGDFQSSMHLYRLTKALKIVNGYSEADSYFYDLVDYDTGTEGLRKRIETDPKRQYLVSVDFHY